MKINKIKIILSAIILVSLISFVGIVHATSSSLYFSPASLIKNVGDTFNTSVGFNTSGNKVCAVEGTLVFSNLSCQSISVADGLMAQTSPTCSNPHFLIGIPNCTTSDKVLLTTSVRAGNTGTASISATGVDLIGEGSSVGSISTVGNYTINALPIPKQNTLTTQQPKVTKTIEKVTPEKKVAKVAPKTTVVEKTNLEANPLKAVEGNTGINSNIVWTIVLILGMALSFFAGRMSYKKFKK